MLRSLLGSELGCAKYLADKNMSTTKHGAQLDVMVQAAVNERACFSQSVVSQYCATSASVLSQPEFVVFLKTRGREGGRNSPLEPEMFYEVIIMMYGNTESWNC